MNAQQRKQRKDEHKKADNERIEQAIVDERNRIQVAADGWLQEERDKLDEERRRLLGQFDEERRRLLGQFDELARRVAVTEEVSENRGKLLAALDDEGGRRADALQLLEDSYRHARTQIDILQKENGELELQFGTAKKECERLREDDKDASKARRRLKERTEELSSAMERIRKLERSSQEATPTVIGSFARMRELLARSPLRWDKGRLIKLDGMSEAHIVGWLKALMATAGLDDKSEWRENSPTLAAPEVLT